MQEDAYLREQYPIYADSNSVFTVLKTGDALEVHDRTEEQIKRRVKKLGLTSATEELVLSADGVSDAGEEHPLTLSSDKEFDGRQRDYKDSGSGVEDDGAFNRSTLLHKIKSKNQAQSDDDSEGMFSSPEVRVFSACNISRT